MNDAENKISQKILVRIEERCDPESIAAYLNFLEAVKLRIEIDSKKQP
jgi:hypothetical protein